MARPVFGENVSVKSGTSNNEQLILSPQFPHQLLAVLPGAENDGMNVLGIGDQPYDELKPELKDSLNEYYKVGSLENYDEVYRAVAFFAFSSMVKK